MLPAPLSRARRFCARGAFAQDYKESAFLQAQVDSGALPPVAERLPENPLVITPFERVGQQGGDWNHALVGGGSLSMLVRYQGYEPLVRFKPDWSGIEANVAESYEVNAEATEYTIKLRKGHKWSDGQPFTTADVQFWYDAYFIDAETNQGGNSWWSAGGEKAKLEVIDETTFKVIFAAPNGFFLQQLAWAQQDQIVRTPAHYLKQFHIKYNPEADNLAKAQGLESWIALFQREVGFLDDNTFFQANTKRPTLNAWAFNLEGAIAPGLDTEQRHRGAQPLLPQGRHRGHAAPVFRPHPLPDGRRSRGAAAEDAAGRDRHDGPVHRDAGQQAGAVRWPGSGWLQLLYAQGDRGQRHGLPAQPQPPRSGQERAVQQQGLPHRALAMRSTARR